MAESGTVTGPESSTADTTSVEFGAAMRDMRKAHNRELSDVANALRIRQTYLQAIEDGRFDDLPGPTYAAGFVRAYADYLGLDLDEVMRCYRSATSDIPVQTPLVPSSPMTEARLPTGFILLIAAVMAVAAYGGWYYLTIHGQSPTEVVSALPKKISDAAGLGQSNDVKSGSTAVGPAPATPVSKPPETSSVAQLPSKAEPEPANIVTKTDTAAVPAPTVSPSDSAPVVEKTPPVENSPDQAGTNAPLSAATPVVTAPSQTSVTPAIQENVPTNTAENVDVAKKPVEADVPQVAAVPATQKLESRVVLRATVTSWVELRDADGKRLLSRLLKAGETYRVPGQSGILFTTGNAGGVDILVDGQTIAALGPVGAVRRDIPMDPETLLTRKPGQR